MEISVYDFFRVFFMVNIKFAEEVVAVFIACHGSYVCIIFSWFCVSVWWFCASVWWFCALCFFIRQFCGLGFVIFMLGRLPWVFVLCKLFKYVDVEADPFHAEVLHRWMNLQHG